jgi:hypothetical protein
MHIDLPFELVEEIKLNDRIHYGIDCVNGFSGIDRHELAKAGIHKYHYSYWVHLENDSGIIYYFMYKSIDLVDMVVTDEFEYATKSYLFGLIKLKHPVKRFINIKLNAKC